MMNRYKPVDTSRLCIGRVEWYIGTRTTDFMMHFCKCEGFHVIYYPALWHHAMSHYFAIFSSKGYFLSPSGKTWFKSEFRWNENLGHGCMLLIRTYKQFATAPEFAMIRYIVSQKTVFECAFQLFERYKPGTISRPSVTQQLTQWNQWSLSYKQWI